MKPIPEAEHIDVNGCKNCALLHTTIKDLRVQITEQHKQAAILEETLKVSAAAFQAISSGLLICQYQPPGELFCLTSNPAAKRLIGLETDQWHGIEFDEMWPNARSQGLTRALLRTADKGEPFVTEAHLRSSKSDKTFRLRAFSLPGHRLCLEFEDLADR